MKKQTYMKPTMQVVELQQRHHLLKASPNGYDRQSVSIQSGEIDNEGEVW